MEFGDQNKYSSNGTTRTSGVSASSSGSVLMMNSKNNHSNINNLGSVVSNVNSAEYHKRSRSGSGSSSSSSSRLLRLPPPPAATTSTCSLAHLNNINSDPHHLRSGSSGPHHKPNDHHHHHHHHHHPDHPITNTSPDHHSTTTTPTTTTTTTSSTMKANIVSHPLFPRLLSAYANCQKVGAPAEVVERLEQACANYSEGTVGISATRNSSGGEDPALDQFMEAYCEMLAKYEQELTKPFKEAMLFLSRIEFQLKALTLSNSACADFVGQNESSEEEDDVNDSIIDPQAEDKELKVQLLRKYSGYLGSLKQEFLKKKKNGKLPKEARQQLLDWWSRHYKWPYPSEAQKLALAESTGLDLKQINNWFINQRKRHWKPSEDMQFVVMDGAHAGHYYMDNLMYNPFPMDCSSTLL